MIPHWILKKYPERYPVKSLELIWHERFAHNFGITGPQFTGKQMGQLKSLRKALGDFTQHVVEWMLIPANWWHFCQHVRVQSGLHNFLPYPHVGFLLKHHKRALKVVRRALSDSTNPADVAFCAKLDELDYKQWRDLVLVFADKNTQQLAKIAAAQTLTDIQQVFIEIVDENTPAPE